MKRILSLLLMTIFVLPLLPVFGQDGLNPEVTETLQSVIDNAVQAGDPGVVLWLDTPSGTFEGASGFADIESGQALQPSDSFRIASVTKMFTATIILQLMEEGVLTLDDTLDEWLPETAATLPYGDQISLRQLLNHTSGVFNLEYDEELLEGFIGDVEVRHHQWTFDEVVAISARHEAEFAPGTAYAYNNSDYALLSMVIEAATGQSLVENYHQRILDPLQLDHTYMSDVEEPTSTLVRGYSDYLPDDDYNASWAVGFGGLVSNAPDLIRFVRALMSGELFSDPATLETMLIASEQSVDQDGEGTDYALGVAHFASPIGDLYGHDGNIFGFNSALFYFADSDTVLVMLANVDESHVDFGVIFEVVSQLAAD